MFSSKFISQLATGKCVPNCMGFCRLSVSSFPVVEFLLYVEGLNFCNSVFINEAVFHAVKIVNNTCYLTSLHCN